MHKSICGAFALYVTAKPQSLRRAKAPNRCHCPACPDRGDFSAAGSKTASPQDRFQICDGRIPAHAKTGAKMTTQPARRLLLGKIREKQK